jgi:VCBS repeat-containing protein
LAYDDLDGDALSLVGGGSTIGVLDGSASTEYDLGGIYGNLVVRGDGSWTYTLTSNTSHDSNDAEYTASEMDTYQVAVTDGSNTSDTKTLNVYITDDIVQVTQVSDGHIANELNLTLNGIFNVVGADNDFYSADLNANTAPTNISSGGKAIHYYVDSNDPSTLLAVTDLNDLSGSKVFTLSVDPNGDSYTLTTHAQMDTLTTYYFDLKALSYPSGPVPEMYITDQGAYETLDEIPPGVTAKILATTTDPYSTDTPDLVNGSGNGLGVDNQWIGDDLDPNDEGTPTPEELVLDFIDPVVAVEIDIDVHSSKPAGVIWTAYSTGNEAPVSGTAYLTDDDGSFTISGLGFAIDKIVLGHDTDYEYYRVANINISETSTENDINLDFNVEVSDSDNDSTTDSISIEFDGDNSMSGTLGEHDVFVGGPENELFNSAQGLGDADIIDNYDSNLDSLLADGDDDII